MSFTEQNLMKNEKVIHQAKIHWLIFAWPIFWILISILLFNSDSYFMKFIGMFVITYGLGQLILAIVTWLTSECVVTNKRIMIKVGFIRRISQENLLSKIEAIEVNQGIFGRLFDYGAIAIIGTGGTKTPFDMIEHPIEFRKQVQEQIDSPS